MTKATTQTAKTRGAVIYTRVSTGEQDKHGTSPERQKDACRAKALALSLPIVAEYYDGGISGEFLLMRKEFQAAIECIKAGRADTLICPNISRYSRDVEHQQAVKKAVKAAGGRLVFCDADFEDTAAGDLNFDIQGSFAAYERKVIRERMMGGRKTRAENGIQPARAKSPYGYHIVTKTDVLRGEYPAALLGKYQIVEDRAVIVREIFARYAEGKCSLNQLAKWLNTSDIKPPGKAAYWSASGLNYLISNTVYKGEAHYGKRTHRMEESRLQQINPHTGQLYKQSIVRRPTAPEAVIDMACSPIVDEDTWGAANVRLTQNQGSFGGNPDRVLMLTGRVYCPVCGGRMTVGGNGKSSYITTRGEKRFYKRERRYACTASRHLYSVTGKYSCSSASFMVRRVEEAVVTAILDAAQSSQSIEEAFRVYQAAQLTANTQGQVKALNDPAAMRREKSKVEDALIRLGARQEATVKSQIAGVMAGADPSAYNAVFAENAAERKDLEDRRGVLVRSLQSLEQQSRKQRKTADGKESPTLTKAKQMTKQSREDLASRLLAQAYAVLTDAAVPNPKKRDIIGTLVEKVICQMNGAEVIFLPGVVGGPPPSDGGNTGGQIESREIESKGNFRADTFRSISIILARTSICRV